MKIPTGLIYPGGTIHSSTVIKVLVPASNFTYPIGQVRRAQLPMLTERFLGLPVLMRNLLHA